MTDLANIAQRLHNKTGLDFQVVNQHGVDVIKCLAPDNAMNLTGKLQQAGFNAMTSVEHIKPGNDLQSLRLGVTIHEKMNGNYFPRATDIETAISNLEQGKIQPENKEAQDAAKKATLKAQQKHTGFIHG